MLFTSFFDLPNARARCLVLCLLCGALVSGCGGGEERACTPGRSIACVERSGCSGTQVCDEGGHSYSACVCVEVPAGDAGDHEADAFAPDAGDVSDTSDAGGREMDASAPDVGDTGRDAEPPVDSGGSTHDGPLLAFPGALGYGAQAKGGRGGEVVYVTNLRDSGSGSLRAALESSGPRTVVFRVAGTIELESTIHVKEPFVTVAGQSAPGGGIALRHSGVSGFGKPLVTVSTHDVILRHVRFRRGPSAEGECCGDNLLLINARDVIIDHCSFSWSTDESLNGWPAERVTIQRSLIAESLAKSSHEEDGVIESHALAALFGDASDEITFIQNVFAHNTGRNPQIAPTQGGTFQVVNNLVVNTCYAMTLSAKQGPQARFDAIGNVIIAGDNTCGKGRASILLSGDVKVYVEDNLTPYRREGQDEWLATAVFRQEPPADRALRAESPHVTPGAARYKASELEAALLPGVGATLPHRDAADDRVIQSVRDRGGAIIDLPAQVGGWPHLEMGQAYADEDLDGMDDEWERAHGLDPSSPDGRLDRDGDGYTNLEEFLNNTKT